MKYMNWKHTLVAGAGTGATLATLVAVIMVKIGVEPPSFGIAIAIFLGMIIGAAFITKKIFESHYLGSNDTSLKQLIPISFLTFILPLLGSTFGAPNSDLDTLLTLVMLGTVGGLFWSTPFALWNFLKSRKDSSNEAFEDSSE